MDHIEGQGEVHRLDITDGLGGALLRPNARGKAAALGSRLEALQHLSLQVDGDHLAPLADHLRQGEGEEARSTAEIEGGVSLVD